MRQWVLVPILLTTCLIGLLPVADAGERHREDAARHYDEVYFWTPEAGWIADAKEVVLTQDGGRTWTPILSVYGPPRGLGIIRPIGTLTPQLWWFEDSGNLWKTTDQGRTWSSQRMPNLGGIVFVAPTEAWAIRTEGDTLMHTQDGGRTWQPVPLRGIDTRRLKIRRLTFLSPQMGWGEVGNGSVAQTTDGGRTWSLRGQAPGGFSQFVFADAQTGFALDLTTPKIYRTRDGGATWDTAQLALASAYPTHWAFALDPQTIWAVGRGAPSSRPPTVVRPGTSRRAGPCGTSRAFTSPIASTVGRWGSRTPSSRPPTVDRLGSRWMTI